MDDQRSGPEGRGIRSRGGTDLYGQELPSWLTYSSATITTDGVALETGAVVEVSQTYYGASIPLGSGWVYGGSVSSTSPPPTSAEAASSYRTSSRLGTSSAPGEGPPPSSMASFTTIISSTQSSQTSTVPASHPASSDSAAAFSLELPVILLLSILLPILVLCGMVIIYLLCFKNRKSGTSPPHRQDWKPVPTGPASDGSPVPAEAALARSPTETSALLDPFASRVHGSEKQSGPEAEAVPAEKGPNVKNPPSDVTEVPEVGNDEDALAPQSILQRIGLGLGRRGRNITGESRRVSGNTVEKGFPRMPSFARGSSSSARRHNAFGAITPQEGDGPSTAGLDGHTHLGGRDRSTSGVGLMSSMEEDRLFYRRPTDSTSTRATQYGSDIVSPAESSPFCASFDESQPTPPYSVHSAPSGFPPRDSITPVPPLHESEPVPSSHNSAHSHSARSQGESQRSGERDISDYSASSKYSHPTNSETHMSPPAYVRRDRGASADDDVPDELLWSPSVSARASGNACIAPVPDVDRGASQTAPVRPERRHQPSVNEFGRLEPQTTRRSHRVASGSRAASLRAPASLPSLRERKESN